MQTTCGSDIRCRAIVENLPDTVLITDEAGTIQWVARSAESLGLTLREAVGRNALELIHAADLDRFQIALAQAVAHPAEPIQVPGVRTAHAGHTDAVAAYDHTLTYLPETAGIGGVLIVARARPHDLRAPEEERLQQAVQLCDIGIFDHDHVSGEIYWSPEQRRIYGWGPAERVRFSPAEAHADETWTLTHPEDRERVATALQRAHAGPPGLFEIEYRIVRRDGSVRRLSTRSQTYFEGEGPSARPVRTIGAVQDVTERHHAEGERHLLSAAINSSHTPFFATNPHAEVVYANESACRSLGLARTELVGRHLWDFNPQIDSGNHRDLWQRLASQGVAVLETVHRRKDGSAMPVEVTSNYFSLDGEEYGLTFAQDVTDRRRTDLELRQSRERLRQVMKVYDIGVFEHDHLSDTLYWSPELRQAWNLGADEPAEVSVFRDSIHPDDRAEVEAAVSRAYDPRGDGRFEAQMRVTRTDGAQRWMDARSQTVFEGTGAARRPVRTVGAMVDVTDRVAAEHALRRSLQEKDTLLREVHHRVKNNLQIIASLLHFQAKKVSDPADLAAFTEGRNRLRAMILVHERLYQSGDLSEVDFSAYVQTLARDLQRSYTSSGRRFDLAVSAQGVALPLELAVPCGMILCELLTNSFKYAYSHGRTGRIEVFLSRTDTRVSLTVRDHGAGLPAGLDPLRSSTFGWRLIRNLAAQLRGDLQVEQMGGTRVTLTFESLEGSRP
ncbi:MAG: PAS domain S-box protein [Steroidobacteraceae bacterium]